MSLAKQLIDIGALKVNTEHYFTWTSGLKSPIYCDNRLIISYPDVREEVINQFVKVIEEKYPDTDVIAGCATAGIPHAAWVADRLNLPMIYVRNKPKSHGLNNQIEGCLIEGQKVVVIEDLISTGGSSIQAANAVKEAGGDVLGIVSIFSYNMKVSIENLKESGYPSHSLLTFDSLMEELKSTNSYEDSDVEDLLKWRDDV
ncbi:orotate phosphoribosyltransferase [Tenuibacillus multivorans]|uniref:Orotate phosphoribosyltransferase n=1 Tax=Tenuibacillus multivorans TaxID=237069 RepID=A0A1G9Y3R7_9BACI|nr:orotate phosphoribosyltransferase [Tenuibacillus multivorans]GEL75939.1 orotate phosphoribosyltransferase [Tenuibacillus multivorans]SDN03764.1 orotate phosphoribosyltransferase [Tenuibacillus multivorans]